ncbi:MAG: 5'-nucleotidase C-terminal domain-containing protein, partial [Deltaproteobacteria bacterium]|nr:5'-nucleotidase C-terminal domain-containing protein [Deltaproteobacteria bacterium]
DKIPGHARINRLVEQYVGVIDEKVLSPVGLTFYQTLAKTDFDLTMGLEESNLGNLVTDSIRWYLNKVEYKKDDPLSRIRVAVASNGTIRAQILKGGTGRIAVCDLFNSVPLGVGWDDTMAYPLVAFYIYPSEIKKAMEVLTTISVLKGEDYFLQISGLKFKYNPYRMLFDRVTDLWIEEEPGEFVRLDYSGSNTTLIRVAANIYNTAFLKIVGDFTFGILNIVPKDRSGRAIKDLADIRVDGDKTRSGIQEVKEWKGLMDYVMAFEDTDGDGLPEIPERHRGKQGRIIQEASISPVSLLVRATYVTWAALTVLVILAGVLALVTFFIVRRFRPKARA